MRVGEMYKVRTYTQFTSSPRKTDNEQIGKHITYVVGVFKLETQHTFFTHSDKTEECKQETKDIFQVPFNSFLQGNCYYNFMYILSNFCHTYTNIYL
jgi:hypothetical protein